MLALAITILFTLAGLVATAVIADSLVRARAAYARLVREGEVLRAGLALQAAVVEMRLRPAPRAAAGRTIAGRRQPLRLQPLPACAAA